MVAKNIFNTLITLINIIYNSILIYYKLIYWTSQYPLRRHEYIPTIGTVDRFNSVYPARLQFYQYSYLRYECMMKWYTPIWGYINDLEVYWAPTYGCGKYTTDSSFMFKYNTIKPLCLFSVLGLNIQSDEVSTFLIFTTWGVLKITNWNCKF